MILQTLFSFLWLTLIVGTMHYENHLRGKSLIQAKWDNEGGNMLPSSLLLSSSELSLRVRKKSSLNDVSIVNILPITTTPRISRLLKISFQNTNQTDNSSDDNDYKIRLSLNNIGIVIGTVLGCVFIVILFYFCYLRYLRARLYSSNITESSTENYNNEITKTTYTIDFSACYFYFSSLLSHSSSSFSSSHCCHCCHGNNNVAVFDELHNMQSNSFSSDPPISPATKLPILTTAPSFSSPVVLSTSQPPPVAATASACASPVTSTRSQQERFQLHHAPLMEGNSFMTRSRQQQEHENNEVLSARSGKSNGGGEDENKHHHQLHLHHHVGHGHTASSHASVLI